MKPRCLVLPLLLYVALDFANPLMPGAVCFDPNASIEGVVVPDGQTGKPGLPRRSLGDLPSDDDRPTSSMKATRRSAAPQQVLGEWFVEVRRAHSPSHESSSTVDDH
jgi:hypothetical protein